MPAGNYDRLDPTLQQHLSGGNGRPEPRVCLPVPVCLPVRVYVWVRVYGPGSRQPRLGDGKPAQHRNLVDIRSHDGDQWQHTAFEQSHPGRIE